MHFLKYDDFRVFERRIRQDSRFGINKDSQRFLEIFKDQLQERVVSVSSGTVFYRAVRDYQLVEPDGENEGFVSGANEDRMLPKREFALEGRVNSSGIVVLYLASSELTAVSEIRPWVGEEISVGRFEVPNELRVADLSRGHGKWSLGELTFPEIQGESEVTEEQVDRCVWIDVDNAFSKPVTRTDSGAEYATTQILTEVIKEAGYDGVAYKSSFGGESGYNVALFNCDFVRIVDCSAFSVKEIKIDYEEIGIPWFRKPKV